jgi:hypothetical protein
MLANRHKNALSGCTDMVGIQEMAKYGRLSGVKLGPVDIVRFAEAFGAKRWKIESPDDIVNSKEGTCHGGSRAGRRASGLPRQSPPDGNCPSRRAELKRDVLESFEQSLLSHAVSWTSKLPSSRQGNGKIAQVI